MKRTALKTDVVDTRYAGHQSMRQSQMPQDMWLLLNGGGRGGGGIAVGHSTAQPQGQGQVTRRYHRHDISHKS